MKCFNNFSLYIPEASYEDDAEIPQEALFLRSDAGVDWYTAQLEFFPETLKVMFDSSGVVCCVENDASAMWPVDCTVVEISADELPENFVCDGSWVWNGKTISPKELSRAETIAKNEATKARLLSEAEKAIAPLQRAVKYGIATDEEKVRLEAWEVYTVLLSRVDTLLAPDIEWPPKPASSVSVMSESRITPIDLDESIDVAD